MKRLYTVTGNLLAETTATYRAVQWEKTHRPLEQHFQVGGKGINVAKMARRLGRLSTAVCFPGGHTGARCLSWLQEQSFETAAFSQASETRSGWVVRARGSETTFLGCDHPLEEAPWLAAVDYLEQNLRRGDTLAICGSLPGWRSSLAESLRGLIRRHEHDVFVAVDTYGPPLPDLLHCSINLVKINRQEFASLLPPGANDSELEDHLLAVARHYPAVRRWVVTAGGDPVLGLEEDGRGIRVAPPPVEVVSPVGCGDVLLAGLVHELAGNERSLEEALCRALPLAAANAASPGIADFELGSGREL